MKTLPVVKLKRFGLIPFSEKNLKQPSIDSVLRLLVLTVMKLSLVFKEMKRLKIRKRIVVSFYPAELSTTENEL